MKTTQEMGQGSGGVHPDAARVGQALEQILVGQPFRTRKQCQDMLRYIVQHSLSGDDVGLRERVVGVEVFGRPSDYDTSDDPVVTQLTRRDALKGIAAVTSLPFLPA